MNRRGGKKLSAWFLPLLAGGAAVACLEILWSLLFSHFPLYWLPTYSQIPALALNALIHIVLTSGLALVVGVLIFPFRKKISSAVLLPLGLAFYLSFMGSVVSFRLIALRDFVPEVFGLDYSTWLPFLWLLVFAAAFIWFRKGAESRWSQGPSAAWPAILAVSAISALAAVLLRWPQATFLFLALWGVGLLAMHTCLWLTTRRAAPSLYRMSGVLVLVVFLTAAGRSFWTSGGKKPDNPNLVLLVWDTVRADRLSLYGYPEKTTPTVEQLAERALVFQQAHSTANFTLPSHITMFTGLYNREHGFDGRGQDHRAYSRFHNLAEALQERGYRTLMATENVWLVFLHNGFDFYFWLDIRGVSVNSQHAPAFSHTARPTGLLPFFSNCPSPYLARQLLDLLCYNLDGYYKHTFDRYLLRLLQEQLVLRARSEPLFFFLNWMNVHNRYHPYREYAEGETISPYDWAEEYDLALRHIDQRLAQLLEMFRKAGEADNTVFILTSDHGQLLGEYGIYGHRKTMFEGVIRVPLVIAASRLPERMDFPDPVSLIGIKNCLEFLADPASGGIADIKGILDSLSTRPGVVAEHFFSPEREDRHIASWAWISAEGNKLIHDPEVSYLNTDWGEVDDFVFALDRDPQEKQNLYDLNDDRRQGLKKAWEDWDKRNPSINIVPGGKQFPPTLEERLRTLGYLQ